MKIAFLFSTLEGFGLVKVAFSLLKELKNNSFDVHAITLSEEPANSMLDDFIQAGIPVHTLNMSRLKGMFYAQKTLTELVRKERFDILHSHGFRANLIHSQIERRIPKTKTVMTIQLDPKDDARHPLGPLFSLWRTHKHIQIIKNTEHVVACAKSLSETLKKYNISIPYIQNGIEMPLLSIDKQSEEQKKLQETTKGNPISVVLSGLHHRKNIGTIIRAYNRLGENFPLIIIGEGPDRKELEEIAGKHIHFTGYQKEPADYLSAADIYLSASYTEGLPLSVMEAMSYGIIPVLSNIPSHREIVENTPFQNFLFSCNDEIQLYNHCKQLLEEKENRSLLKQQAKMLIKEKFSSQKMANEYINYYKKCLE